MCNAINVLDQRCVPYSSLVAHLAADAATRVHIPVHYRYICSTTAIIFSGLTASVLIVPSILALEQFFLAPLAL